MEKDEQLKQILLNSAAGTSPDFTDTVMKKVNELSTISLHYQPLVSGKLRKLFLFLYILLAGSILVLCLRITFTSPQFVNLIETIMPKGLRFDKILVFILSFWIVFGVKSLLEKKIISLKKSFY